MSADPPQPSHESSLNDGINNQSPISTAPSSRPAIQRRNSNRLAARKRIGTAANGQTYAVATHADGSPVTATAPVQQGETITLYGTGFGPTTPARPFGFAVPGSPSYTLNDGVTIQIGSATPIVPVAAYAVPGSVGVDAVQFVLGSDAPSGTSAQFTVTINGQTFTPGDAVSLLSALEAFIGLIIEVTFIATLTQRFFNR